MAYIGKYIDRNPCIKAAGISLKHTESAGDTLNIYNVEEVAENIVKTKCRQEKDLKLHPELYGLRSPYIPEETMKDIISTDLKKSRFVAFREKFSEDMYFKKAELGKVLSVNSKPESVTNENTTFGDLSVSGDPVYELILPRKSPDQVNREYIQWHDKYVLSHNHYLPAERINRHYDRRYFNPANSFGMSNNVDIAGRNVKRCLTTCDHLIIINKAQKDFYDKTLGQLGKKTKKIDYNIPKDIALGLTIPRDKCDAKAVLENINPCVKQTQLIESLSYIHKLRRSLFKRINFHIYDLKLAFKRLDVERTGFLSLEKIFEAAQSLRIMMDQEKIKTVTKLFDLFSDEQRINYEQFLKILQIQHPLPKTKIMSTLPDNLYNKETTYRELCKDINKKAVQSSAPPTEHRPQFPKEEKTTTKDLVQPEIAMHYGLGQSDFEIPRPKDDLKIIFRRVIEDEHKFDEIWQQAKTTLNRANALISVDEFRLIMNSVN